MPVSDRPLWVKIMAVAGGLALLLCVAAVARFKPEPSNLGAYTAAADFVRQKYPGAKDISAPSQSAIEVTDDSTLVQLTVDGLNAFGGPVRSTMVVELVWTNQNYWLKQIVQK